MALNLKKFIRNDTGQVAVIFALAALPLLALTSAAIDFSQVTKERTEISSALDAAVLAAANNNAISVSEKDSYAEAHFLANYGGDITLDLTSSVSTDRVRLVAQGELPLDFGNLVGIKNPSLTEASAATLAVENTICVLALSEEDDASIFFDREMEFLASGCAVHSNSKSTKAIYAENNVSLPTASSFCAVGGVSGEVEPHSKGECSPVSDPYAMVEPAPLGQCKSEFFMVSEEPEVAPTDPSGEEDKKGAGALDPNIELGAGGLPTVNPLAAKDIQKLLDDKFENHTFHGLSCSQYDGNPDPETGIEKRDGNTKGPIELVSELGGEDMRLLLAAYDAYGGQLNCKDDPKPACLGFNNPFLNESYEDVPSRWVVAEIFDMSYGAYMPDPADVPDIVTSGVVELINGELYSRNNLDGELVPVSENLTGGDIMLTPGTYCGGLTVDGLRVQFSPGDYIFKDGPLTFLNKSQAIADRVTFGFRGAGATLNIESGSNLKIRSATEGPRKGLAFMQNLDPEAPGNRLPIEGTNRISSGGSISMSGTAYFPEQTLLISGEDTHLGASSPAVGLIAKEIKFRGDQGARVEIAADYKKAGIPPIQPQVDDGVRLVE